jgi:prevent-host-death family protein
MRTASSYEAKTRLAELLRHVQCGESITITKHGVPIAKLVPFEESRQPDVSAAISALIEFRKGNKLSGLSIREMIEEGRA